MPDHIHFLFVGISDSSDQRLAAKFLRRRLNEVLKAIGFKLQAQGHDHVLTDEQREHDSFENIVEYIARNPERAALVPQDRFRDYPYTGCLVPGYPELRPFTPDYWTRFWRTYAYLRKNGLCCGEAALGLNSGESGYE